MDYVKIRTHIATHVRFLEAGALARDLYTWGMLYAGQHETDGDLPRAAIIAAAWGHGDRRNLKLADRLVEVGLWETTEAGYRVLRWSEQGNVTRAELDAQRAAARQRMKRRRSEPAASMPTEGASKGHRRGIEGASAEPASSEVRANARRTSADVPVCTSTSPSSGSSSGGGAGGTATDPPPPWFAVDAVGIVAANTGLHVDDLEARWLEYSASRERKGWPMNTRDATGWLTSVLRGERARAERPPPASGVSYARRVVQPAIEGAWEVPEAMP